MKRRYHKTVFCFFENILFLLIFFAVWIFMDRTNHLQNIMIPSLQSIACTFARKVTDKSLILAVEISVERVFKGYLAASALGVICGIFIGLSKHMYRMTRLIVQIMKPIPPIAWIPLVILWMGIGEASKVFLIFLGGFFVVLINVIDGVRYVDSKLIEVATATETPKLKYVFMVIIPAALPNIFTGLKVALGTCWSCVIAAELVAADSGIGYMITVARNFGQMDIVIIGMVSIGLIGKIMDEVLRMIERKVLCWNF